MSLMTAAAITANLKAATRHFGVTSRGRAEAGRATRAGRLPALYRYRGDRRALEADAVSAARARALGIRRAASCDAGHLAKGPGRAIAADGVRRSGRKMRDRRPARLGPIRT